MYSYQQYSSGKQSTLTASAAVAQRKTRSTAASLLDNRPQSIAQRKTNTTGLPDQLKSGIESLSGYSMNDVKVHFNSSKPAQLNAHAYAQGTDIHLASGQEKHLPHEAWHVAQQKQGRVQATKQLKSSVPLNDDDSLEKEADTMGAKAMQMKADPGAVKDGQAIHAGGIVQRSIFNKLIGNTVSDLATLVGGAVLGIGGPAALNTPSYGPRTGRGFGTYVDVRLNYPPVGTKTGDGLDNPTWVALGNRRLGSKSYYFQAHLLSRKLGGSGTNWLNLVPLTSASNSLMQRSTESHVKLAARSGSTVRYKVQAFYGQWPWQWPAYWVAMLSSPWLRLLMPGIYSSIALLRDAEQHVPSVIYAQWWIENGEGSWIPFVRRIPQIPNSAGGFWVLNHADNQVYDMNKTLALWKIAEHTAVAFMMPMLLPKLAGYGVTKEMAAALSPTQFLQGLAKVTGNIGQWMFDNKYDLDVYFNYLGDSKLRAMADIFLQMFGKVSLYSGPAHSANQETVDMLESVNAIDAPQIHAMPARTTKAGTHF